MRFFKALSVSSPQRKRKFAATRRLLLKVQNLSGSPSGKQCFSLFNASAASQSKLLKKAASMLVAELEEKREEKERVVNGCFPPLKLSGMSVQELQVQKAMVPPPCLGLSHGT